MAKKGLSSGLITQKQYDKLPPHLLDAIVKKKMATGAKPMKKQKAPPRKRPAPRRRVAKAVGGKGTGGKKGGKGGKGGKKK